MSTQRGMMAKIHIAKKDLGLDDDTYRDLLERVTGRRSAKGMGANQMEAVLREFKAKGWKPKRKGETARTKGGPVRLAKVRALWISLYHLGVTETASEEAMAKWIKRQAKVDALRWLSGHQINRLIEALKLWAERAAGVNWQMTAIGEDPRACVLEAQWKILYELGVMRINSPGALSGYLTKFTHSPCAIGTIHLSEEQADALIAHFGGMIRATKARGAGDG